MAVWGNQFDPAYIPQSTLSLLDERVDEADTGFAVKQTASKFTFSGSAGSTMQWVRLSVFPTDYTDVSPVNPGQLTVALYDDNAGLPGTEIGKFTKDLAGTQTVIDLQDDRDAWSADQLVLKGIDVGMGTLPTSGTYWIVVTALGRPLDYGISPGLSNPGFESNEGTEASDTTTWLGGSSTTTGFNIAVSDTVYDPNDDLQAFSVVKQSLVTSDPNIQSLSVVKQSLVTSDPNIQSLSIVKQVLIVPIELDRSVKSWTDSFARKRDDQSIATSLNATARAWWSFDDTTSTVDDKSSSSTNMTLNGSYSRSQPSLHNHYTSTTLSGGYAVRASVPSWVYTDPRNISISFWLQHTTGTVPASGEVIITDARNSDSSYSTNLQFQVSIYQTQLQLFWEYGSGTNEITFIDYPPGFDLTQPHHYVVTRNVSLKTVSMYIDGKLIDTVSYANNPDRDTSYEWVIGSFIETSGNVIRPLQATIQDVAMYDSPLKPEHVIYLHNNGKGVDYNDIFGV